MPFDKTKLLAELERDEGLRLKPYKDTVGKLTIGIGRNLDDVGITHGEAYLLLANDVARTYADLVKRAPWFEKLDDVRQRVLLNMAFNLGTEGLMKFTTTLTYIRAGNYKEAAKAMLNSKWAGQVGQRAVRLAKMMETGQ